MTKSTAVIQTKSETALAKIFAANGSYDNKPLHLRHFKDQLQDHDMQKIMPKSYGTIDVLAALRVGDPAIFVAISDGIQLALDNPSIQHVLIPIGPGHWRSMCLSKPIAPEAPYQLELFDPYGRKGAKAIEKTALTLLSKVGIPSHQIQITYVGPQKPQCDGYACGDFTCAYSHQKMRDLTDGTAPYHA